MDYPITIHRIFISDGHNYFGQPKGEPGTHQTREIPQVKAVAGRGLEGDRFFDARPDFDGQVTFFSLEVFRLLASSLDLPDLSPLGLRRNVIIEGVPLNQLIGRQFTIRTPSGGVGVDFSGSRHCNPCRWMDVGMGAGALKFLKGRGGLRARILTDGVLCQGGGLLSVDESLDLDAIVEPLARPRLP